MDMQVAKKKLGLKERYAVMTRGLDWTPSYQKMEDIYPYIAYEGINFSDDPEDLDKDRMRMELTAMAEQAESESASASAPAAAWPRSTTSRA